MSCSSPGRPGDISAELCYSLYKLDQNSHDGENQLILRRAQISLRYPVHHHYLNVLISAPKHNSNPDSKRSFCLKQDNPRNGDYPALKFIMSLMLFFIVSILENSNSVQNQDNRIYR